MRMTLGSDAFEDQLLADLNEPQRQAVTHFEGPALILAGPGSGKTRVITRRIAWLIAQGVKPWHILAITFTNKAAGEMRARVEAIAPQKGAIISTFHSFGVRFMRQYAARLGFEPTFTIYDQTDRGRMTKIALEDAKVDSNRFSPEAISGAISRAKNQLLSPDRYAAEARDFFSRAVAEVYPRYEKRMRDAGALDFDDLLYWPALALRNDPTLRTEADERWRFVLVDEYQDTNTAQYAIARNLCQDYPNLLVVGDPDQSIYKFRGSDIRNILDFERDYPGAKILHLSDNYRSSRHILRAADALIANNQQRKPKKLTPREREGRPVEVVTHDDQGREADAIARLVKEEVQSGRRSFRDFAVLLRMNALTRAFEQAFIRQKVPFQIVKGLAFFDRKENKDVLAYLRLLVNIRDDVSFLRVVNEPPRGIGATTLERLQEYANSRETTLLSAAAQAEFIPDVTARAAQSLSAFARLIGELQDLASGPPHEAIKKVLEKTRYRESLKTKDVMADDDRIANIEELVTAARQFSEANPDLGVAGFLENITLAGDIDSYDAREESVTMMTLHAAKGLEFPVVFLPAMEQGILPHERSLNNPSDVEEERRLCFVGITRAMEELHLSSARMREFRGRTIYTVQSMFLSELPSDVKRSERGVSEMGSPPEAAWLDGDVPIVRREPARSAPTATAYSSSGTSPAPYEPGEVVQHDTYGLGQVLEVSGHGATRKIRIRFITQGLRTFLVDKVVLKKVARDR